MMKNNDYVTEYGYPTIAFQQTAGKFHDRYIILITKRKQKGFIIVVRSLRMRVKELLQIH